MNSAVVIPTRDRGSILARAVESALRQTLPVREVIVVDDGSLDDTANIVRGLARSDDRVRLIAQDGASGAAAARNRGVRETQADWICFLDSDDAWEPRKHEAQAAAIASTPAAVACFTGLRYAYRDRSFDVLPPNPITTLDLRGANVVGSTSSAMIRRETFDAVGGFDPVLPSCQDWDLWIKLHRVGEFALVGEALVTFTQDGNDRISRNREAVFAGHRIVFDRALHGLDDRDQRARVQARHHYRMAQILLEDMDEPVGAALAALRSIRRRPSRMAAHMFLRAARTTLRGSPAPHMTLEAMKHTLRRALRTVRQATEDATGLRIIKRRPWGLEFAADLRQSLPAYPMGTVFDVGANLGQSARVYAKDWPDAEIHSFEPARSLFDQLVVNTGRLPRVRTHRLALGVEPGEVAFIVDGELSHIRQTDEDSGGLAEETVRVERLTDFCSDHQVDRIDFLKIDTEGFDLDVLKGADEMLRDNRIGFVQVEAGMSPLNTTHVPFEALKSHLEARGYYLFALYEQVHEWKTGAPVMRRGNPVFISSEVWRTHRVR